MCGCDTVILVSHTYGCDTVILVSHGCDTVILVSHIFGMRLRLGAWKQGGVLVSWAYGYRPIGLSVDMPWVPIHRLE